MPPNTAAIIKWKKPRTDDTIEGKGKSGAIYRVGKRPVDKQGRPADPLRTIAEWKWFYESRGKEGGPFYDAEVAKTACHNIEESALVGIRGRSKSSLRAQAKTKAVVDRMRKARADGPQDFDDQVEARVETAKAAIATAGLCGIEGPTVATRDQSRHLGAAIYQQAVCALLRGHGGNHSTDKGFGWGDPPFAWKKEWSKKAHPAARLLPMLKADELAELAADIKANHQKEPITLTSDDLVLDGRNRLEACRLAGVEPEFGYWAEEADGASPTQWVLSKNVHRRHLTPSQAALIAADSLPLLAKEAKARLKAGGGDRRSGSAPVRSSVPEPKRGKAAKFAAKAMGVSTRIVEQAKAVIASASAEEVEKIRTGEKTIKQVARETRRAEQREEIKAYLPPTGKFQLITTDFSWKYRDTLDGSDAVRGAPPYPPQTVEEIIAFVNGPLANCCDEVCLYGAWVTNPILLDLETWPKVQAAIEGLGFRPVKLETWRKIEVSGKDFTGLGNGVRNDTEQLVLFARGQVIYNELGAKHGRPLQRTCFDAPKGEHSEKPALAYERLEQLVPYTSRLEMFSRAPRAGWVTSGSELPVEHSKAKNLFKKAGVAA